MSGFDRTRLQKKAIPLVAALAVATASVSPDAVFAQAEDSCTIWHDPEIDGVFTPAVIEIRLNGDVGSNMENQLFGILQDNLTSYPSLKTIKILLSSDGGYVESGFRIHNYLRGLHERHGLQVVTHNTGAVQSSAVDIYCSGNQRIASPYSYFMVHNSSRKIDGDFDVAAIKDFAEEDELGTVASHQIFSACTTVPIKEVGGMFAEQTYLDPDRALELGLAHSITPATYDRAADIRCSIDMIEPHDGAEPRDEEPLE